MAKMSYEEGSFVYYKQSAGNNYTYNSNTAKYIDTYAYGDGLSNQEGFNRTRLGDATGEVVSSSYTVWYNDLANFVYSSYSWFFRGGDCSNGSSAGVFGFSSFNGSANSNRSARAALLAL